MTRKQQVLLAGSGSAALMIAALLFQHVGGMAPCKMCIWQRYPHYVAIVVGILAAALGYRALALIGALAAATTSAIGFYHAGVEQGWWPGPATCSAGPVSGLSTDALLEQILSAPLVRCDEIPWDMFGISMAGWNGILSLGLALLWLAAYRRA